jgi:hypothetical protein
MMNENPVLSQWPAIKIDLQKSWSKLTTDDLDKTNGEINAISALIQKQYGEAQYSFSQRLAEIFESFGYHPPPHLDKFRTRQKL